MLLIQLVVLIFIIELTLIFSCNLILTYAGKSTTASMLAYVMKAMGDDLTAIVGAHVPQVISYLIKEEFFQ